MEDVKYSPESILSFLSNLRLHGNVEQAARATGISGKTGRAWIKGRPGVSDLASEAILDHDSGKYELSEDELEQLEQYVNEVYSSWREWRNENPRAKGKEQSILEHSGPKTSFDELAERIGEYQASAAMSQVHDAMDWLIDSEPDDYEIIGFLSEPSDSDLMTAFFFATEYRGVIPSRYLTDLANSFVFDTFNDAVDESHRAQDNQKWHVDRFWRTLPPYDKRLITVEKVGGDEPWTLPEDQYERSLSRKAEYVAKSRGTFGTKRQKRRIDFTVWEPTFSIDILVNFPTLKRISGGHSKTYNVRWNLHFMCECERVGITRREISIAGDAKGEANNKLLTASMNDLLHRLFDTFGINELDVQSGEIPLSIQTSTEYVKTRSLKESIDEMIEFWGSMRALVPQLAVFYPYGDPMSDEFAEYNPPSEPLFRSRFL